MSAIIPGATLCIYLGRRGGSISRRLWESTIEHAHQDLAKTVGLYRPMWQPVPVGMVTTVQWPAASLIGPMHAGIDMLEADTHDAYRIAASYSRLREFALTYLEELMAHPDAFVYRKWC